MLLQFCRVGTAHELHPSGAKDSFDLDDDRCGMIRVGYEIRSITHCFKREDRSIPTFEKLEFFDLRSRSRTMQ
jgi:hypothetical protein